VTWAYKIEVARPGQERKTQHRAGFRTAVEAAAARAKVVTDVHEGMFVPASKLTLGQYLDRWYATGDAKGWKPNTKRDYRVGIAHTKRYPISDVPLQQLTRENFRLLFAMLLREGKLPRGKDGKAGPMAPKTVANVYICLHAAMADAESETPPLRRGNPATGAYSYSRERAGEELQCWTLDEMQLFLPFVAALRDAGLYAVALATGMRRGELLGLRRRDVDLKHGRVSVRRQWTKAGDQGRKMVPLKTGQKAWRTIDLDPFTVAVLERQYEMIEAERREWGTGYQDQGLVFPREDGTPQDPDQATRAFTRLAEQCPDVPRIIFHGMRHTHATLLLEDGVSLKVVAERLGDREDTVVKLYGHITPRGRAAAVASVGRWWKEAEGEDQQAADESAELRAEVAALKATIADMQRHALEAPTSAARDRNGTETAPEGAQSGPA
jgi:integrase